MYTLPNAKINIGLNITGCRSNGYHDLQTIFYPIPLTDSLEINYLRNSDLAYELLTSGLKVQGSIEDNLIIKVFASMQKEFHLPAISINLSKHIPMGAGLGGGSSDAAFMLKLLNDFFSLDLTDADMEQRISSFGADCPFFIRNKPTYAEGIGNVFSPITISLKDYFVVLVKPAIHISTKEAYSKVVPKVPSEQLKDIVENTSIEEWRNCVKNDFEEGLFITYPKLGIIKNTLYDMGALYASMSGSGSTIYGLFNRPVDDASAIFPDCFTYFHKLN